MHRIQTPNRLPAAVRRWRPAAAVLAVAALAACGGGGGGGDDEAPAEASTVFSSGVIHGLGSVVVNGVRYDDSGADVRTESGDALRREALRLGMVVDVEAAAPAAAGEPPAARRIVVRSEVEGPVSAVDAAAGTLTVLGQSVVVNADTVYEDLPATRLAALAPGDVVEVHGFRDDAGTIVATRVDREDRDEDDYELRGAVAAVDAGARTLRVGGAEVAWGGAWPATLAPGASVLLKLQTLPQAGGLWRASSLRVLDAASGGADGDGGAVADGVRAEVEGLVTGFAGAAQPFRVGGVRVDASALAALPTGFAAGARVEVEGRFADGLLVASRIEVERDADRGDDDGLEIEGAIESVDAAARTLVVRGVTVDWSAARFEEGTAAGLAAGVRIEVQGTLAADGRTLQATEVDFDR